MLSPPPLQAMIIGYVTGLYNRKDPPPHPNTQTHTHTLILIIIKITTTAIIAAGDERVKKRPRSLSPMSALSGWSAAAWQRQSGQRWTRFGPLRTIPLPPSSSVLSAVRLSPVRLSVSVRVFALLTGSTLPAPPRWCVCVSAFASTGGRLLRVRAHPARRAACAAAAATAAEAHRQRCRTWRRRKAMGVRAWDHVISTRTSARGG